MQKTHNRESFVYVAIVGGGPAGCSLAAILGAAGISVACIDRDDPAKTASGNTDFRTTAISFGSRRVFEEAGIWEEIENKTCAIRDIEIRESGSPVLLDFLSEDVGEDAFGWIIENNILRQSLFDRLKNLQNVRHLAPAQVKDFEVGAGSVDVHFQDGSSLRASIVIGADGRQSFTRNWMGINTRGWSYNQRALVCVVTHENPHNNIAVEDFRPEGPFAILPMTDDTKGNHRSSIVWTEHGPEKSSALHWDESVFEAALNERFPSHYGRIKCSGKRFSYPLGLIHAHTYIGQRMALVGDAAHGIHPIAGQGLNLGLRDVAEIAGLLIDAHAQGQDLGSESLLQKYQSARRLDNMAMAGATDMLNKLFSNNITPLRLLRKAGLKLVQRVEPARKFFMLQAMGKAGILPSMIRDKRS